MKPDRELTHTAIYLAFSIAGSGLGFVSVVVLTRLLPLAQYGVIGLFFSLLYFAVPLISLSAEGLVAVSKTTLDPHSYRLFQQSCIALGYLSFATLQIVFLVGLGLGWYDDPLLAAVPIFALVRFFSVIAGTEYIADERPVVFGSLTLATSAVALILTVVLARLFGPWGAWRIAALFLADVLLLMVRFWGRATLFAPRLHAPSARQILRFGIPGIIAAAGAWGLNEADKVVVANLSGMNAAGLYTAAAALATVMMTFNQSLANALYPGLFRGLAANPKGQPALLLRYVGRFTGLSALFCTVVAAAYFGFASEILPPRYASGGSVFAGLMIAGVAMSFYRPFGLVADYYRLAKIKATAIVLGGALTMTIAWIGVRKGGLLWAPAGIAFGYICAALVLGLGLRWRAKSQ